MTFMGCSLVVPRPCTVMTQVSRGPGRNQAGRVPSSPGISTSRWSRPRAEEGSPLCSCGVTRTLAPVSRTPRSTRTSLRTTVSGAWWACSITGPTTAWTSLPTSPYIPGRRAVKERVRVTCPAAVACTVSLRSAGSGRPDGARRAASLAYRPAATAAAPTPRIVVTAAAVTVAGRTASVSWGCGSLPADGGRPGQPGCPYPLSASPTSCSCRGESRFGVWPGTELAVSQRRQSHSSWAVRSYAWSRVVP